MSLRSIATNGRQCSPVVRYVANATQRPTVGYTTSLPPPTAWGRAGHRITAAH